MTFIVLIVWCSKASAQNCALSISGKISISEMEGAEGAAVMLTPGHNGTAADQNGNFVLEKICPGAYRLEVRLMGYETVYDSVLVNGNLVLNFKLEAETTQLSEVVVHDDRLRDQGMLNSSVMNQKDLFNQAGKSLGEALNNISGVTSLQAGPGIFKPVIHGMHSQRILILNNGIRQESQQWGAEHAPEIDPMAANSIRVVKDASAIRYGSDALGGVVVVTPAEIPDRVGMGGSLQMVGQSNGRSGIASGSLQGGVTGAPGWGWRIQGTARRAGDFNAPNYQLTNTALSELNFSGTAGYHNNKGGFELYTSRFTTELGILRATSVGNITDLANAMTAEVPAFTSDFGYKISEPRQEVAHQLSIVRGHRILTRGRVDAHYAWQKNQRKEFDIRRGALSELPAMNLTLDTHSGEVAWDLGDPLGTRKTFGISGTFQSNKNVFGTQRVPFIPDFNHTGGGLFGAVSKKLSLVTLDGGIRFDYRYYSVAGYDFSNSLFRRKMDFGNLSGTAGVSAPLNGNQVINVTLSSAWRPPHVAELFSLGTHQSAAAIEYGLLLDSKTNRIREQGALDVKGERAFKWVTGWKINKEQIEAEVTGYINYVLDYFWLRPGGITRNARGTFPYFRYEQTNALFFGADAEGSFEIASNTNLNLRASWIRASDERNSDLLAFIPANRIQSQLKKEWITKGSSKSFFAEIRGQYVFRQNRAPRVILPSKFQGINGEATDPLDGNEKNFDFQAAPDGYFLLGTSVGLTIPQKKSRYEFRLHGDNLLNSSYRDYTNRLRYFADELGRNIRLSANIIF